MNKLLIFPGVGSPENMEYEPVYSLLEKGAKGYGYDQVSICHWPGQSATETDILTLGGAVEIAKDAINSCENEEGEYSILGRSFGTIVAARVLSEIKPTRLNRVIMWGPPPYSVLWKLFKLEIDKSKQTAKGKGTRIDNSFFDSIIPFESLILSIDHTTVIATGTEDPWVPPSFIGYLETLLHGKNNLSFRVVNGAGHDCSTKCPVEVQKEYLQKLLDEGYRD